MLKLAILASGTGSNALTIIQACQNSKINAEVKLVFSNNPKAAVLTKAQDAGVPIYALDHKDFAKREDFDQAMLKVIQEHQADFIVMAGYMRLVSPYFIQAFEGKIVNIHPALLPAFAGVHGAKDAHDWGVKISGCTVHFVDEIMDHGAVIIQAAVIAKANETSQELQNRIHKLEHRIYPQALQWIAEKRISQNGRQIILQEKKCKKIHSGKNFLVYPPLEDF